LATAFDAVSAAQKLGLKFVRRGPGDETIWRCPFGCDDDSRPNEGHFYVNARTTTCYCHKCGWEGNLVTLYAELKKSDSRTARRELGLPDDPAPPKMSNVAPVEHRDLVYREFLRVLSLYPEHRQDLLRRGLDEAAIFRNGYKSVPRDPRARWKIARHLVWKGLALEGVPGFFEKTGRYGPYWDFFAPAGYLIPVRNERGQIQALKVRLDAWKYVWFSSEGYPKGACSGTPPHYTGGTGKVCVTEGPLKADVAHHLSGGKPFVGTGGVHATKGVPDLLKSLGVLDVLVAFDADQGANPNVRKALQEFLEELRKKGFRPQSVTWPPSLGKGIDDVFLRLSKKQITSVTFMVDGVPMTLRKTTSFEIEIGGKR